MKMSPKSKSSVNLTVLARKLNLSPSTVSRALNDHPAISAKTASRVRRLAKRMNYVPNAIAVSLRTSSTGRIALLTTELKNNLIDNLEKATYALGYVLIVRKLRPAADVGSQVNQFLGTMIDAAVVCCDGCEVSHYKNILGRIPAIFILNETLDQEGIPGDSTNFHALRDKILESLNGKTIRNNGRI